MAEPESTSGSVVAVVWTYNRVDVVRACVQAVRAQRCPPRWIVVADSASTDHTVEQLRALDSALSVVSLECNDGMGAAIAAGLRAARQLPYDYVWFVEDDSAPAPDALEQLVCFLESHPEYSIVGARGAVMRHGRWKWMSDTESGSCTFCMLDGSLVRRAAVDDVGVPREDFFIMQIDVEYPLRMSYDGHRAYQLAGISHGARQLGAASTRGEWRSYYQTRNHLRIAIDHRSPSLLWGFCARTGAQLALDLLGGRSGWAVARLRIIAIVDALRHRMGRTVEPSGS